MKWYYLALLIPLLLVFNFILVAAAEQAQTPAASGNIYSPANTVLSKEIQLTPAVQSFLQGMFKLPAGTPLTLQSAVLLAVLFLVVFFVVNSVITLIPFFEVKIKGPLAALIITILTAVSGGMYDTLIFLTGFSNVLTSQNGMNGWGFVLITAILAFVAVVVWVVMRGIRKLLTKEEARTAGFKVGKDIAESKLYGKLLKKSL